MADTKISALSTLTKSTVATNDSLPIVDTSASATKQITYQELMQPQDDQFAIADNADNTKKVAFQVSGVTTGTTRTLTVPDANTTIVGTDTTVTLSNKTLGSGTKVSIGSDATGDMYYRDGSGNLTRLAIGTAGQILDVSAGGIPEWIANPSVADSSTTVKGVVEIATTAEINAGTGTGGTGAKLVMTPDAFVASNYAISPVDIQTFTANGTWTKPTGAKTVHVEVIGGGGSGAGGAAIASPNYARGGSGGGGGALAVRTFKASDLGATVSVTVGAQVSGGNGAASASNDGSDGTVGNTSSFGTILYAYGGGAGLKGTQSAGNRNPASGGGGGGTAGAGAIGVDNAGSAGGNPNPSATVGIHGTGGQGAGGTTTDGKSAEYGGGAGGMGNDDNTAGNGGSSMYGAAGGGGGGGFAVGSASAGGAGGSVLTFTAGGGGTAGSGAAGGAGTAGDSTKLGTGGGGGGGITSGTGYAGGAGGAPGGGGGGGGGGQSAGGAGGAGARGEVRVYTYF